ncbi:hypothetical protein [Mycoplana rhizolycopersici]|uniref:Uncharacterized protein n=1 Tax=Mycoplana rhizolycopersici TaxID=2746702 RepID=A0ABX2QN28_9HYPH|nr:hypothetical protein [Rhizobium rhizolycopersici]NVP57751.1 hypothetical protein [Rhizobium rhizolycopersici]
MILDVRFLVGVAVGATLALMISPEARGPAGFDLQGIKNAIFSPADPTTQVATKANWPSDESAKKELFRWSKWDLQKFGPDSTVHVNRCIYLSADTMACEMVASLSWLKEDAVIEGVFSRESGDWTMTDAKGRRTKLN